MTLAAGTRLGAYEIVGLLASGGMGEVYRARDRRLAREVAVKVIAEGLSEDPNEHARFEQEARMLASLSHPSILSIFDFGEEQGVRYAVMELLVGKNLRERMAGSALPWRTAVAVAVAVAKGLAAAHARGIVHRDLKPENIFLLVDGGVKILDFGLARRDPVGSRQGATPSSGSFSPVAEGVLVGTTLYMAPEQVCGQPVDARTDIFGLGCVLYEMLTGHRPFARVSIGDTMAAILNEQPPPLAAAGRRVPGALARVVSMCLEKEAEKRIQSAYDLAFALDEIIGRPLSVAVPVSLWPARIAFFVLGVAAGIGLMLVLRLLGG
jgi:serine/threonine protein kinase